MARGRLNEEITRVLIADIVAGAVAAGEFLPRETDLMEQFQVSRGVVRECMRGLEDRGLVAVTHGRGARVSPPEEWDVFDREVLAALLQGGTGAKVLRDYLECRQILEVEAAGLAARRASPEDLAVLGEALALMREAALRAQRTPAAESFYIAADIEFHRAVVAAAHNAALRQMTAPIHRALASAMPAFARPRLRFKRGLPEHERILGAIAARDPDGARAAMRSHLATVERYLREYAKQDARPSRAEGRARSRRQG